MFSTSRRPRWDRATAFFASLPGALALVLMLADTAKADMRKVTISQCIRLFFLVAALPAVIEFLSPPHVVIVLPEPGSFRDVAILVLASAAAALLLESLKVPAGLILGSALVSAILGLSGIVQGGAPQGLLIISNVVLGVMIGGAVFAFQLCRTQAIAARRVFVLRDRACHLLGRSRHHRRGGGTALRVDAARLCAGRASRP